MSSYAYETLSAEHERLRGAAIRVLVVLDTYGQGNFVECDDLREVLDGTPSAAQTLEDPTPTERAEAS